MASGYYITTFASAVAFPTTERWGSAPHDWSEGDLVLETERGKRWVYKQFRRRARRLAFRVTEDQLAFFEDLHSALGGQETPFYFLPDVTDAGSAIFVRKEKDFQPREFSEPATVDGVPVALYDYDLILTEEPTGPAVEA